MRTANYDFNAGARKDNRDVGRPKRKQGWQTILQTIIDQNNLVKVSKNGTTSYRTRTQRAAGIFLIFNTLTKELRFGIEDPHNIKVKHIQALIKHWIAEDKKPGTIELYLSNLRTFCTWIKKPGMVLPLKEYAPEIKRVYAAEHDKSFTGNEIEFWDVWEKVYEMDKYVGMQLLLIKAFGLRRKEAVSFKPIAGDKEYGIEVFDGSKGGKPRTVPINDDFKMGALAVVKNHIVKTGNPKKHMGHPDKTLEQNLARYTYVLNKCGVTKEDMGATGHGLRAEYAIDQLIKRGIVPTIRGGEGKGLKSFARKSAALMVAEELGHCRWTVMPAYAGRWMLVQEKDQYALQEINGGLE